MAAKLLLLGSGGDCARPLVEAEAGGAFEVVAFVAPGARDAERFLDRPLVTLEEARARFPREECQIFACGDERFLNQDRLSLYMEAKKSGYRVASIVSASALVAADVRIRENVLVGAQARILPGANIGANTWLLGASTVGEKAQLGSSCWMNGAELERGAVLGKNCTVGRGVLVRAGVQLPAWSFVGEPCTIAESPASVLFRDPLFRAPVVLRGAAAPAGARSPDDAAG